MNRTSENLGNWRQHVALELFLIFGAQYSGFSPVPFLSPIFAMLAILAVKVP